MKTVVILGASATKACGGPLTNEILPVAYAPDIQDRERFLLSVEQFLRESSFLQPRPVRQQYPPLPLLLSLIDIAVDLKHAVLRRWDPDELAFVRDDELPTVISLNYGLVADNTMSAPEEQRQYGRVPDNGCEVETSAYKGKVHGASLLKIPETTRSAACRAFSRQVRVAIVLQLRGRDQHRPHWRLARQARRRGAAVTITQLDFRVQLVQHLGKAQTALRRSDVEPVTAGSVQPVRGAERDTRLVGYGLLDDPVAGPAPIFDDSNVVRIHVPQTTFQQVDHVQVSEFGKMPRATSARIFTGPTAVLPTTSRHSAFLGELLLQEFRYDRRTKFHRPS